MVKLFLDSYTLLGANLDKSSTTSKLFPTLDKNGMRMNYSRKASPYDRGQTIESIFEPLKIRREDYFSTLKQS